MTDEQLKSYLGAVEKVRQERTGTVDAATHRTIARELGLSDEDLAAARAQGEADLTRGEGFLRSGLFDEAVSSLDEAVALLPDDLRALHALARARQARGESARARELCRRCLEIEPRHEPSFAMLRAMDRRPKRVAAIAIGLLVVAGGAAAAMVSVRHAVSSARCPDRQSYCSLPVPLAPGGGLEEIGFMPGVIHVTPDDARLDVGGKLVHAGDSELERLELQVVLFDGAGKKIGGYAFDAMPAFAPPLRPGDSHAFYESTVVPKATVRAELSAGARQATRAPASYGAGAPIPLSFEPAASEHFKVRAAWRSHAQRAYQGKSTVEGVIEVTNAGEGVIRQLDVELRGLDAAGAQVGDGAKETVAYPHMLPMAPGETRSYRGFLHVTGQVATERLVVTQVQ